jgi:hypothetical protein
VGAHQDAASGHSRDAVEADLAEVVAKVKEVVAEVVDKVKPEPAEATTDK